MIDIIVSGAMGRMGTKILTEALLHEDIHIVGVLGNPQNPAIGKEIQPGLVLQSNLANISSDNAILVDFSTPAATVDHIVHAKRVGMPVVVGTTGFSEQEEASIADATKTIPILESHNYGIGMNAFWEILKVATQYLGKDFDIEIIEFHGASKPDVPSGTGNTIASIIAREQGDIPEDVIQYGREKNRSNTRKYHEIGIHSLRGGSYRSDHTVIFAGNGERLEFTHREEDSSIIARGVMWASRFLQGKSPGVYHMADVLDFMRNSQ